ATERGEVLGFWVHRDQVSWHFNKEREWQYLSNYDYNYWFPRDQGKGYSKDKGTTKHV
ncbi:unnamed protein product, partial [Prorocentrum cordatum]